MDFILNKNKYSCIKFRFYPRLSHMHSFDDEPPKDLEGVYTYKISARIKGKTYI